MNSFVRAMVTMYENGEMEKICNQKWSRLYGMATGLSKREFRREQKKAKEIKALFDSFDGCAKTLEKGEFVPLLMFTNNVEILQTAIIYMVGESENKNDPE